MPAGKASIEWDGYELLVKYDPYRPDIAEEIKSSVPQAYRRWDAEDKCWRVSTIYKPQVEEIFDVFEYAVRDYTGSDPASKTRQAGLRAIRDARLQDNLRQSEARAREREQRDAEQEARKREADKARARAGDPPKREPPGRNGWPYNQYWWAEAEAQGETRGRRDDSADAFRAQYEAHFDFEDAEKERLAQQLEKEWRQKFFAANPECLDRHFKLWWSYFTLYGREEANRRFNVAYAKEQTYKQQRESRQRQQSNSDNFWKNFRQSPAKPIDHYVTLGIVRTCSYDEAKAAYRQLAIQWHPDRNPGKPEALEMMKKVNVAWDAVRAERQWR